MQGSNRAAGGGKKNTNNTNNNTTTPGYINHGQQQPQRIHPAPQKQKSNPKDIAAAPFGGRANNNNKNLTNNNKNKNNHNKRGGGAGIGFAIEEDVPSFFDVKSDTTPAKGGRNNKKNQPAAKKAPATAPIAVPKSGHSHDGGDLDFEELFFVGSAESSLPKVFNCKKDVVCNLI